MDYTTLKVTGSAAMHEESPSLTSLYAALQELPDPRRSQGERYELALILCVVVLAKLAGQTTVCGATQWLRHRSAALAQRFGLRRTQMPCQMTYCNILAPIDAKGLDEILSAFFLRLRSGIRRCAEEPSRLLTPEGTSDHSHLAIDGKALRATSTQAHPIHQLSCYEVATGRVLWHCNVQEKHNEISELKPL